jgi:hypothetical protein
LTVLLKKSYIKIITNLKVIFMQLTPDQLKNHQQIHKTATKADQPKPTTVAMQQQNIRPINPSNIKMHNNPSGAKPAIFRRNSPNQG